jgi:hypothetical protein
LVSIPETALLRTTDKKWVVSIWIFLSTIHADIFLSGLLPAFGKYVLWGEDAIAWPEKDVINST